MKEKTSARAAALVVRFRVPISALRTAQKLSAAALSKHEPARPVLALIPKRLVGDRNWLEVYSLPRSLPAMQPGSRPPRPWAMSRASMTRSARRWSAIA